LEYVRVAYGFRDKAWGPPAKRKSSFCFSLYQFRRLYPAYSTILLWMVIWSHGKFHLQGMTSFSSSCRFPGVLWKVRVKLFCFNYQSQINLFHTQPFYFFGIQFKIIIPVFCLLNTFLFSCINLCIFLQYTGLFEMIVGVLTTCHTQYTSDSSICIFFI